MKQKLVFERTSLQLGDHRLTLRAETKAKPGTGMEMNNENESFAAKSSIVILERSFNDHKFRFCHLIASHERQYASEC
jgi:hypothetical protein